VVFVTNYRRPVFTREMLTFCEHTTHAVCAELDINLVEINGDTDHLHPLVAYPHTLAISTLAHRLNGRTAYPVRREHTARRVRAHMCGHLESPPSSVSCGNAPPSITHQYIDGQARPP
jgi:putative transposase